VPVSAPLTYRTQITTDIRSVKEAAGRNRLARGPFFVQPEELVEAFVSDAGRMYVEQLSLFAF